MIFRFKAFKQFTGIHRCNIEIDKKKLLKQKRKFDLTDENQVLKIYTIDWRMTIVFLRRCQMQLHS